MAMTHPTLTARLMTSWSTTLWCHGLRRYFFCARNRNHIRKSVIRRAQLGENHKKKAQQSRNTVTLNRGNIPVLPAAIGPEAGALVGHVGIPGGRTTRAKGRTDQLTLAARYSYRLSRRGTGIRYAERYTDTYIGRLLVNVLDC